MGRWEAWGKSSAEKLGKVGDEWSLRGAKDEMLSHSGGLRKLGTLELTFLKKKIDIHLCSLILKLVSNMV